VKDCSEDRATREGVWEQREISVSSAHLRRLETNPIQTTRAHIPCTPRLCAMLPTCVLMAHSPEVRPNTQLLRAKKSGSSLKVSLLDSYTNHTLPFSYHVQQESLSRTTIDNDIFHGAETLIETRAGTSVTKSMTAGLV